MRLLNAIDFTLREFSYDETPPYAILSHCWSQDPAHPEVTYEQIRAANHQRTSYGWQKISKCCRIASNRGLRWVWIDTCCIDKSSSMELTEAINSMYRWYRRSKECYAFLDDILAVERTYSDGITRYTKYETLPEAFRGSRWFTRGWTLQELLAPISVLFFDIAGHLIGSRSELRNIISSATGIPSEYLTLKKSIAEASIAQRMSWASRRQTGRVEDQAYSLLGIFEVNLPLLYGEGTKAFLRLQLAILQQSSDQSIFAWGIDRNEMSQFGMLAQSPSNFANSERVLSSSGTMKNVAEPTQVTNQGIAYSYTTSAGELLRRLFIRDVQREQRTTQILLPCVIGRQSGETANLLLIIEPFSGSYRGVLHRLAVRKCRDPTIVRFLRKIAVYESKAYIAYTRSGGARSQDWFEKEITTRSITDILGEFVIRPAYFTLRAALSIALFVGCMFVNAKGRRNNSVFTFGMLILARDLAKCFPMLVYVEDLFIVIMGTSGRL